MISNLFNMGNLYSSEIREIFLVIPSDKNKRKGESKTRPQLPTQRNHYTILVRFFHMVWSQGYITWIVLHTLYKQGQSPTFSAVWLCREFADLLPCVYLSREWNESENREEEKGWHLEGVERWKEGEALQRTPVPVLERSRKIYCTEGTGSPQERTIVGACLSWNPCPLSCFPPCPQSLQELGLWGQGRDWGEVDSLLCNSLWSPLQVNLH